MGKRLLAVLALGSLLAACGTPSTLSATSPANSDIQQIAADAAALNAAVVAMQQARQDLNPANVALQAGLTPAEYAKLHPYLAKVSGDLQTAIPPAEAASAAAKAWASGDAGDLKTLLYDLGGTVYDWTTVAPQYSAIVVNDWDASWIPAIKAASPTTKVFVYKDISSVRDDDCGSGGGGSPCIVNGVFCPQGVNDAPYIAAGVGFCWAWRNDPSWFLRDSSGTLIQYEGYPGTYMVDFGAAAYQAKWLSLVKADVQSQGFNGVAMDNALTNENYGTPASYPTPATVQAATLSFLKVVDVGLTAAGILGFPNLGYNNLYPNLWTSWLPYVSGFLDEYSYYWSGSSTSQGAAYWSSFLEPSIQACVNQEKVCTFNIGGGTLTQAQVDFGEASILLYNDGNQYVSFGDGTGQSAPAVNLGAATDSAYETSDGVWHRDFVGGSVSVNPATGVGTI